MSTRNHKTGPITSAQVRAAMLGSPLDGVRVVRQAWRVTDDDSDELALLNARGSWWVARRLSAQVTIWFHTDEIEAEDGFEQLLNGVRAGERPWTEAARPVTEAATDPAPVSDAA